MARISTVPKTNQWDVPSSAGTSHLPVMRTSLSREIDDWDVPFIVDGTSPPWQNDDWDIPSPRHGTSPPREIDSWDVPS
jgi:hypothetical protein